MSVSTHPFRSHTGKSTAVTVAQSLHGGGCLIVGCEQIANLSIVIKDNEEASTTGLFFDYLTSSEILNELSNQTTVDLQTFQKVIFTPSCHDVSIDGDLDVTYTVRLKELFSKCEIYICDYIYSPKQICMGLLCVIRQANLMIENLNLPVLKISCILLENDYTATKTLEIPVCDYFLEENNSDKSSVTVRGCNVFQQKLLSKLSYNPPLMSSASCPLEPSDPTECADSKQRVSECADLRQRVSECADSKQRVSENGDSKQRVSECGDSKQRVSECADSKQRVSEFVDSKQRVSECDDSKQRVSECDDSKQRVSECDDLKQRVSECVESKQRVSECADSKQRVSECADSKQRVSEQRVSECADLKQRVSTKLKSCKQVQNPYQQNKRQFYKVLISYPLDLFC